MYIKIKQQLIEHFSFFHFSFLEIIKKDFTLQSALQSKAAYPTAETNLPRSGTGWVTGTGTLVDVAGGGGGAFGYPLELSAFSAFPLPPETTVGIGFPTLVSFALSSFILATVARTE